MKKLKVALIHNIIAPYRIPVFVGLSNHPSIDLKVYYCAQTHKMRKWEIYNPDNYNSEVLPGITLEYSVYIYHINPSIIYHLIKEKYDAIIMCGYSDFTSQASFIVSKIMGTPVILWTEGIESSQLSLGKLFNPVTDFIVRKVDAVIVPGTLSRNFVSNKGSDDAKIFIAPDIVDNEWFIGKSDEVKNNIDLYRNKLNVKDKKIILYVGRLVKDKGLEDLLRAFKKVKNEMADAVLMIVGDGDLRGELENICESEQIKDVIFIGWVNEEKIVYYSLADVFVLPTRRDVWGMVVNEAMCCGLPVITTTSAGCAIDMIVDGYNGYVITPGAIDQLSSNIARILSDDELRTSMGINSRKIILDKFTLDSIINGVVKAIDYSIKKRG